MDDNFDDNYKAIIEDLKRKCFRQEKKALERKLEIDRLKKESSAIKDQHKRQLIESKKCIDNLSAELGRIKRKLKRQEGK